MRIGELSRLTGVSIPTIRVYEREGLIGPALRTAGKFREFTSAQCNRLTFIRRMRNLGFDLGDVKTLLSVSSTTAPSEMEEIARRMGSAIGERKRDLDQLERYLTDARSGALPFDGIDGAFSRSGGVSVERA